MRKLKQLRIISILLLLVFVPNTGYPLAVRAVGNKNILFMTNEDLLAMIESDDERVPREEIIKRNEMVLEYAMALAERLDLTAEEKNIVRVVALARDLTGADFGFSEPSHPDRMRDEFHATRLTLKILRESGLSIPDEVMRMIRHPLKKDAVAEIKLLGDPRCQWILACIMVGEVFDFYNNHYNCRERLMSKQIFASTRECLGQTVQEMNKAGIDPIIIEAIISVLFSDNVVDKHFVDLAGIGKLSQPHYVTYQAIRPLVNQAQEIVIAEARKTRFGKPEADIAYLDKRTVVSISSHLEELYGKTLDKIVEEDYDRTLALLIKIIFVKENQLIVGTNLRRIREIAAGVRLGTQELARKAAASDYRHLDLTKLGIVQSFISTPAEGEAVSRIIEEVGIDRFMHLAETKPDVLKDLIWVVAEQEIEPGAIAHHFPEFEAQRLKAEPVEFPEQA